MKITTARLLLKYLQSEGLGAQGFRIEKPGELSRLLPQALVSGKPTAIDCIIDLD